MKITALWHINKNKSTLISEELGDPNTNQFIIKSLYSLISVGTEKLVAKGQVPVELHHSMQVPNMGGNFNFPVKYGYSLVGQISSNDNSNGKSVHLLHPHQNTLITDNQSITNVSADIPPQRATLASNLETALNAIWDGQISIGDKVLVCGFGMIGSLVARVLSLMPAVQVCVAEKDAYRMELAKKMGFQVNDFEQETFDVSIHTSGTSQGLQACINAVGMEGKIVELSWYGTKAISLNLGANFHFQRKQLISSQVSHIPFSKSARWNYQRRKATVMELLKNPLFDEHITNEIAFEDAPAFFEELRTGSINSKGLGWVIRY